MEKNKSFWLENFEIDNFKKLEDNIKTEVCIIGGGITGIMTAYYLCKNGIDVVVVEKDHIASKTTGHTTGKISAQHGLFYKYLVDNYGLNYAKKYANANLKSIEDIKKIIESENLKCDFEIKDSIVYSQEPQKYKIIQEEAQLCKDIGIDAMFTQKIDLPLIVHGAVKFRNQAQFNPVKYLNELCKVLIKKGCSIYTNSKVIDYKKVNGKIKIIVKGEQENYSILADNVVVATRYPIFNFPGLYFLKNYQELEYAMCVDVEENIDNLEMYLDESNPKISYRTAILDDKRYLLVVGNGAKTGEKIAENEYEALENHLSKTFRKYTVKNKWVAEDVISLDKIPYIGRYSKLIPNMYVATGYKKWGMTTSNISAKIISDKIMNNNNKISTLFNSNRLNLIKNRTEMKNVISTTTHSLLKSKENSRVCSHLGCKMCFNQTTQTWDCPCHGSRFEKDGKLIDGPSTKNLK